MPFIIEQVNQDDLLIKFQFEKSACVVRVEKVEPNVLHIISLTDGYHWLQFWMAQSPVYDVLHYQPFEDEIRQINGVFKYIGIVWEQEDKESAFLHADREIDDYDVNQIAIIMEERFALREIHFNN